MPEPIHPNHPDVFESGFQDHQTLGLFMTHPTMNYNYTYALSNPTTAVESARRYIEESIREKVYRIQIFHKMFEIETNHD